MSIYFYWRINLENFDTVDACLGKHFWYAPILLHVLSNCLTCKWKKIKYIKERHAHTERHYPVPLPSHSFSPSFILFPMASPHLMMLPPPTSLAAAMADSYSHSYAVPCHLISLAPTASARRLVQGRSRRGRARGSPPPLPPLPRRRPPSCSSDSLLTPPPFGKRSICRSEVSSSTQRYVLDVFCIRLTSSTVVVTQRCGISSINR
jgi:hypothetical protein